MGGGEGDEKKEMEERKILGLDIYVVPHPPLLLAGSCTFCTVRGGAFGVYDKFCHDCGR